MSGVNEMVMGEWKVYKIWLWLRVVIMVFYIVALTWVTRPARMAVATGGSQVKSGMQVVLQMAHVLWLFGAFALMELRPI